MPILPPAGWYPDPHGGPTPRWWDGRAWGPNSPVPRATETAPSPGGGGSKFHPTARTFVIVGVVGLVAVLGATTGGVGSFLAVVGLGAVVAAIVALVRGGIPSLALRSRTAGAIALIAGLVVVIIGGGVGAATSPPSAPQQASSFADTDQAPPSTDEAPAVDESPDAVPSPAKPAAVIVVTRIEVEEAIPFSSVTVDDPTLPAGTTVVTTAGVAGVRVVSYEVTTTNGVETDRVRLGDRVAVAPINQVTSRGTQVAAPAAPPAAPASPGCDSNYSGCVPIASDVDCAGGGGNGPAYLSGTVTVIGRDIYELDRDHDGTACE